MWISEQNTSRNSSNRVLKNSYSMSRATNLECADNGGALDLLAFSWSANPKRCPSTLAAALQISFFSSLLGEVQGLTQTSPLPSPLPMGARVKTLFNLNP